MLGLRVTVGSLLGAAGLLIAMIGLPAAASAANISITYAGPDASGNPYDLTVTADDANGLVITSMTAHVLSGGTSVYDATMAPQSTGSASAQTWVASPSIPQADLPPGTYTVTVDATDADEADPGLQAPSSFSFAYTSTLAISMQPAYVTQGSQNVTFTGQLTGVVTGGSSTGIAGAPVLLSIGGGPPTPTGVLTGSDGSFTYQATGVAPGSYVFSVAATATYSAASDSVSVPAEAATTSIINLQASQANVTLGSQNVTFTGTVQMVPPNSTTPVGIGSGVPVYVSVNGGTPTQATTTDDANGDFSYTAMGIMPTGVTQSSTFAFSVPQTTLYGPFTAPAITIGTQTAPTAITAAASPAYITYGSQSVTFTGSVQATPGSGSPLGVGSGVPVYLSVNGGTATQVATTSDANGDFSYHVSGLTASGTYTFSVNGTSLYSAATYPVQVNLDPASTSISVSANPPDIHLGSSTVTFNGTVSVTPSGSTTAGGVGSGVPVYLSVGGSTPAQVATTSDANGDFTYTATNVTQPGDYEFSVHAATFYTAQSQTVAIGLEQLDSTLTVTASAATVTAGAQTITFSGTVTGLLGTTGPQTDIPNAPVDVTITTSAGSTDLGDVATTDSSGNFTYTTTVTQAATYQFSVANTSTYTKATASAPIGVVQAQTRITDDSTSPAQLSYNQTTTLTGTVQYLSGSTWTALPGAKVQVDDSEPIVGSQTPVGSVTSGADGTFTAQVPARYGTSWTATVSAATLTQQTQASGSLIVNIPVEVKSFSAGLNVHNLVVVRGCIEAGEPIGYGPQPVIDVQYRTSAHRAWSNLGSQLLRDQGSRSKSCRGAEESFFSGTFKAKSDNAYYRAYFPNTPSAAGYGFLKVTSDAVHSAMTPTRLAAFTVSPRTVKVGQPVHLKVQLQRLVGRRWEPWAGQDVTFKYDFPVDKNVWHTIRISRTNRSGEATAAINGAPGNFVISTYAFYLGSQKAGYLAAQTKGINVDNSNPKSAATPGAIGLLGPLPRNAGLPLTYPTELPLTPLLESQR